ncbi:MAG: dipeptide epimerase [Thermoplasmata archaeon]|nr:MAG: dipeptide epimerase [Thermoplasmata archaeon]
MNIKKIDFFPVQSERKEPFIIATGSSNIAHNIIVKVITNDGVGIGNACPNSVTKETPETILMALKIFSDELKGENIDDIEEINTKMDSLLERNPSAKAGVDIALYDLHGKIKGMPVFEIFGKKKEKMLTDMTIGIMDLEATINHAVEYKNRGFKALKIKIGLDKVEDVKRIKATREAVGEDMIIRVDANQGYDVNTAIEILKEIEPYNIEQVEQPVKWDDLAGLKEVKDNSPIPITADESVKTKEDAFKLAQGKCADKINIKLMKCGGITKALEINKIAEENGLNTMIGCMSENRISISAGLHFALSQENVRYADLDSHFSLIDDDTKGGFIFEDGYLVPLSKAGFGIEAEE